MSEKRQILILTINHPWFENRVFYKVVRSLLKVSDVHVRIITGHQAKTDTIKCEDNFEYEIVPNDVSKFGMVRYFIKRGLELKPDIVICIEPLSLIAGFTLKKKINCRFIYDCHEYYSEANHEKRKFLTIFYNFFESYLTKRTDSIVTVNDILVKFYKKSNQKTFLCANYPLQESFQLRKNESIKKEYDLFYAGSLSFERGLKIYLETAKLFKTNDKLFNFLILGNFKDVETAKYFKEYIQKNNLKKVITYLPYQTHEEVLKEINKTKLGIFFADIKASPRYDRAIAVKIFDYMTQSIPVVINKLTMLSDLINKAQNGWIIDYNSKDLYRFLCIILENESLLNEKGKNGYEYAIKNLSWENQEADLFNAVFG